MRKLHRSREAEKREAQENITASASVHRMASCLGLADLQTTIGIDEHIGRLDVAMNDVSRMDVMDPAEELIQEVLIKHTQENREQGGTVRLQRKDT